MRKERAILSLLAAPLLYSMSEPAEIPPELRDLKVKVTDAEGVTHSLRGFRCGDGVLRLKRGALSYNISLSTVRKITLLSASEGIARVRVEFRDGGSEEFSVPASTKCESESDVGNVSFYISEIREIELQQGESR